MVDDFVKELLLSKKKSFSQYVFASLLFIVTDVTQALVLARIFQAVEVGTQEYFWNTVFLAVGFIILSAGLFLISRMLRIKFMRDILLEVRIRAFEKVLSMSYPEYNKASRDVYLSHLTNDINTFENTFFVSLLNFIFRCGSFLVIETILLFLDWRIGLLILGSGLIVIFVSKFFEDRTVRLQEEKSTENEKFVVNVANTFNGLEILKLNNIEKKFLERAKEQTAALETKKAKFTFFTALQSHTNEAIGLVIVFLLLVFLMYRPDLPMGYGRLVLIIQLSGNAVFPLMQLVPLFNVLKSSEAIYQKITKRETENLEADHRTKPFALQKQIDVKALGFAYDQKTVFRHLDFTIKKGKKYLLTGPSGAGKTTLLKLLSLAYDDYQGSITVDGVDLKSVEAKSFHENAAFLHQDVFLFEASLLDNISLFRPVEREWVETVLAKSGLSEFLAAQEQGLDTPIPENGKNLSGGERQRIAIARALCRNASLLFVDEATSSLNEELGRSVESEILALPATVIAISHRYYEGVTEKYDYVLELKDGYINQYAAKDYFQGGKNA